MKQKSISVSLLSLGNFFGPGSRPRLLARHRSAWFKYRKTKSSLGFSRLCPRVESPAALSRYPLPRPGHLLAVPRCCLEHRSGVLFQHASHAGDLLGRTSHSCGNLLFRYKTCSVPPSGIEPLLQDPQSCVLSVERRGRRVRRSPSVNRLRRRWVPANRSEINQAF